MSSVRTPSALVAKPVARSRAARSAHREALEAVSWMTPPPCPDAEQLMRSYEGAGQVDFGPDTEWSTQVLDDVDPVGNQVSFWRDDFLEIPNWPRYDSNNNRHVWVRSEAIVRGEKRAIVAWVKIEDRIVAFPRYAILAGYIHGKNSGGHGGRTVYATDPDRRFVYYYAHLDRHRPELRNGASIVRVHV